MRNKILVTTSILSTTTAGSNYIAVNVVEFPSYDYAKKAVERINNAPQHSGHTRQTAIVL